MSFSGAGVSSGVIEVFGIDGRRVARVPLLPGVRARWDGRDERGHAVPGGLYLARIQHQPGEAVKFLLMR